MGRISVNFITNPRTALYLSVYYIIRCEFRHRAIREWRRKIYAEQNGEIKLQNIKVSVSMTFTGNDDARISTMMSEFVKRHLQNPFGPSNHFSLSTNLNIYISSFIHKNRGNKKWFSASQCERSQPHRVAQQRHERKPVAIDDCIHSPSDWLGTFKLLTWCKQNVKN